MGTYTTNKNLFMPSVGEQGWGDLVNGNFETIDTFLKPITVSGSTYTFTGSHVGNQSGGSISATSISNSGTLTNTGKITANGGIGTTSLTTSSTITSTGKITANGGIETKALTATSISNSGNMTNTGTLTCTGKIYANGGLEGIISSDSVYHYFTETQPYPWSSAVSLVSPSKTHYQSVYWVTETVTFEATTNLTQFFGIGAIDNSFLTDYKVSCSQSPNISVGTIEITVTNIVTNEVLSYSFSPGNNNAGNYTIQVPAIAKIYCLFTCSSAKFNVTVSISPKNTVYMV